MLKTGNRNKLAVSADIEGYFFLHQPIMSRVTRQARHILSISLSIVFRKTTPRGYAHYTKNPKQLQHCTRTNN